MNVKSHFDTIAPTYNTVRYTDTKPIDYIMDNLPILPHIKGAEFGTGTGRYSHPLLEAAHNLHLTCIDLSSGMLATLHDYLAPLGEERFSTIEASIADVQLLMADYDAIFSFNAVHHFDLEVFLLKCSLWLKPAGQCFIYTRLREQNSQHIWGRYFPDFAEKEDRLYTTETFTETVKQVPLFDMVEQKTFTYNRQATLSELLTKIDQAHYSTFRLYTPEELQAARAEFVAAIKRDFSDMNAIQWQAHNTMFYLRKRA